MSRLPKLSVHLMLSLLLDTIQNLPALSIHYVWTLPFCTIRTFYNMITVHQIQSFVLNTEISGHRALQLYDGLPSVATFAENDLPVQKSKSIAPKIHSTDRSPRTVEDEHERSSPLEL